MGCRRGAPSWPGGLREFVFSIGLSWFGETAGALIAPFGFLLVNLPAPALGFFGFASSGALIPSLNRHVLPALAPTGAAASFAFCEWFRSEGLGPLGVPFASLAYTAGRSPLGPLGAYAGSFGVTFALCVPAAYSRTRFATVSRPIATSATFASVFALALSGAWWFWPARTAPPATTRVAAIQGNIPQTIKFTARDLRRASRVTRLTAR